MNKYIFKLWLKTHARLFLRWIPDPSLPMWWERSTMRMRLAFRIRPNGWPTIIPYMEMREPARYADAYSQLLKTHSFKALGIVTSAPGVP